MDMEMARMHGKSGKSMARAAGVQGEDAFLARQGNSYHSQNARGRMQQHYTACKEAFPGKHRGKEWGGRRELFFSV